MKPEPHNMKVEDEEDLLYGESGSSFKMKNVRKMEIQDIKNLRKSIRVICEHFSFSVGRLGTAIKCKEKRLVETTNSAKKAIILALRDP